MLCPEQVVLGANFPASPGTTVSIAVDPANSASITADDDAVPGFAPSLATMLASFDQDSAAAKRAFCGLEAEVYSPRTGKTVTLYIADAFDDKWVRTPSSIDVLHDSVRSVFFRLSAQSAHAVPPSDEVQRLTCSF